MLTIDLGRLARDGIAEIEAAVPVDDPLWADTELRPGGALEVRARAQQAGGDVVVQGRFQGTLETECRRCLTPLAVVMEGTLSLVYRPAGAANDEDGYVLPARGRDLDLREAVREDVLLAAPRYAVCREDCKGLCPRCGKNLNEGPCSCTDEEADERWAPLLKLKDE
ncbi:MAG: DUF177 domain-containing protein [Gemmatimonadota bacterium]|jgi:uncharacterized protein